jgi:hypothetical protein
MSALGASDAPLRRKLAHLRLALRLAVAFQGAARLAALLSAAILATFAVDYGVYLLTFQLMTVAQRLAVSGLCAAGLLAAAWKGFLRPLLAPLPDEDLALMLERRHRHLGERFISALYFARFGDPERLGISAELVERVREQARAAAETAGVGAVIRRDRLFKSAGLALGAIALISGLGLWRPALFSLWFQRNVLLAEERWPRDTRLSVANGARIRVARGEPLLVTMNADPAHVVPDRIVLHLKFSTADAVEETVERSVDGSPTYLKKFDAVTEPFIFWATGNDDRTPDCVVEIAEPPQLAEVSIAIRKPEYMRMPPAEIPGTAGTLNVPLGSILVLRATATKDLQRAAIYVDGLETGLCSLLTSGSGTTRTLTAQLRFEPEKPFRPAKDLRVALTDREGYTNSRAAQYKVALLPDRPPAVQFAAQGLGSNITLKARIPYVIEAQDDYGLRAFILEWASLAGGQPRRQTVLDLEVPEKQRVCQGVLDLEPLTRDQTTEKSPLNLGDTLRLLVRVLDSLPGPEGPNETVSAPILFKLTSEDDLLAALAENQRAAREQFNQLLPIQAEAVERTAAALDAGAAANARRFIQESANLQFQVQDRVSAIVGRFEEILERMQNNRIGGEPEKWHLRTRVIDPLRNLAGVALRTLSADLAAARNQEDAAALKKALPAILELQRKVHERMQQLGAEMLKIENAQQVEREWRAILEQTQKVKNILETERRSPAPGPPEPEKKP